MPGFGSENRRFGRDLALVKYMDGQSIEIHPDSRKPSPELSPEQRIEQKKRKLGPALTGLIEEWIKIIGKPGDDPKELREQFLAFFADEMNDDILAKIVAAQDKLTKQDE